MSIIVKRPVNKNPQRRFLEMRTRDAGSIREGEDAGSFIFRTLMESAPDVEATCTAIDVIAPKQIRGTGDNVSSNEVKTMLAQYTNRIALENANVEIEDVETEAPSALMVSVRVRGLPTKE